MRLIFTLLTILLSHSWTCAFTSLRPQYLTMADGLPSNYVHEIAEDGNGMLWFGNSGGMSRFDGNNILNFRTFPIGSSGEMISAAITHITTDKTKRFIWAKATNHCFFCYDTQTGRFIDYAVNAEQGKSFREIAFGDNGTVWLYQGNGVRRCTVTYPDNKLEPVFHCTDYTVDKGQLPYREVRTLLTTGSGGAWLCADKGLAYIDGKGEAHIIDKKRKVYQAMRLGGGRYAFFMTGNRILVGDDKGGIVKDILIPAQFGTVNRITGYVCEAAGKGKTAVAHAFTNGGTLAVDVAKGVVRKSDKLDISEGMNFGTYQGYTVVTTRSGEIIILDRELKTAMRRKVLAMIPIWSYRNSFSVSANRDNTIMIAARTWGLLAFNTVTGEATELRDTDPMMPQGYYYVRNIMFDSAGNLWGATQGEGVFRISNQQEMIGNYIKPDKEKPNAQSNSVEVIIPEPDGSYTVATKTNDMFRYDPRTNSVTKTLKGYSKKLMTYIERTGNYVTSVCYDAYGNKWTGLGKDGIFIGERLYHDKAYNITGIQMDRHRRVWFIESSKGLKMVPSAKAYGDSLKMVSFLDTNAGETNLLDMKMDSAGRLWLAAGDGLHTVDTRLKDVNPSSFRVFNSRNSRIPGGSITCLAIQEKEHRIWCGLEAGGLAVCRFNDDWTTMTECDVYTMKQGLAAGTVNSVICGKSGELIWVGTDNGLSLVSAATGYIKTYRFSQRSIDNYFNIRMMRMLADERVLCGTAGGLLVIQQNCNPFKCDGKQKAAGPTITDFHIDGESVFTDFTKDVFDRMRMSIINDGEIRLEHDQNNIAVFFSNTGHPEATTTSYQYYLDGFDSTWRPPTSSSRADFAHLSPGTYTLHVRSLTGNKWSKETAFTIHITPPWYASWYAYIIYICMVAMLCRYIYKQIRAKYRYRKRLRMERQQRDIEQKLADYKVNFFTNVSHEFRTPLTIIQGVTERIKTLNRQGDLKQPIDTLKRSTERMLRLVNQLMEFRRMQQGRLSLCVREEDIVAFIHNIFMDFHETAYAQDIDYHFSTSVKELNVPFDSNHLDKIMYNLISNAFKYSKHKGHIEVRLRETDGKVMISVSDNGVGVDKDMQEHLFDNYMKSSRLVKDSLGIGLTLTAALAKRHHGTIEYQPNMPSGSVFTVTLPTDSSAYGADEFMVESPLAAKQTTSEKAGFEQIYREIAEKPLNDCTALVVEDDADMAEYIVQSIAKFFKIKTAKNGADALRIMEEADDSIPQLIVTDAMMPQMDGFQLTAKLRKDDRFRTIPIIMLTALSQEEKQLKGIATGVDIYLCKPFSPNILAAHAIHLVNKHISMKRMVAENAETETGKVHKAVVSDIRDKNFMEQVDAIINSHIGDENLSVETLTDELGIGRSKLFEKMKQLCDMTPRDYILRHRMEYACKLLKDGNLSIAEIAYKTGFGHPPYFTRVFKKHYGVTPTEYIKR